MPTLDRLEAVSGIWRLPPVALCGILLFFSNSSYCQQVTSKPLQDAPLSPLLSAFDASKLTGDGRRTFDVLTLIIEDTDKATAEDKRNGYLQEFLTRSQDFVREHPDSLPLWTLRAVAALEVNEAAAGQEACERMIGLKAGNSDDPKVRRVLAMVDRRGWFKANAANESVVTVQGAKSVPEQSASSPAAVQIKKLETNTFGPVAYDAKWGSYGAYLHKMMAAIQSEWDRIVNDGKIKPPSGSVVTVKLTMDWKGYITEAEILEGESTSSEEGKQCCITAINMASPYGEWTDNMIATLGASQQLKFAFFYDMNPAKGPIRVVP
jgi:hypothetical protein